MTQSTAHSIRNRLLVARLPAMPQILFKLMDLCQKDEAGMGEISKLISHDVAISTKILSVANSSAYNRGGHKVTLMQALNTLGIEMIKTLVITESVYQTFSSFSRTNGTDLHGFWVRSLKAAVLARELAKKTAYPHSDEAYLAGLLHDVGRLAFLSAAPREYATNFMARDDQHLCVVEASSMGISHAEAGAWLIERWNLDSFLADSVRYHHEPVERLQSAHPLIRLVCLAHLLTNYKSDSPSLSGIGRICGVDDSNIKTILAGVITQTKTAATYFGIDLTGTDRELPTAEYEPLEPVRDRAEERLADEVRNVALVAAAGQAFSRLQNTGDLLESISRTARVLFNLEDVVVLLHNENTRCLVGVPIGEHQQRLSEFSIPVSGGGILADALLKRKVTFVARDDALRGLVEEQLMRSMNSDYLAYIPLAAGQACLGILVCGLSALQSEQLWGSERFLQSFATQAATTLEAVTAKQDEIDKRVASVNREHQIASRKLAHEVNNPLSIIKNYLGVLDDKLSNNEPVVEELSILNEEINRVSRIVDGQVEKHFPDRIETVEVNAILKDVVRLFSISRYLPSSVNVAVKTTVQTAEILGSADPLRQILLNLIKNAVEALPKGGSIEVKNNGRVLREGRGYLELCISDNGAGMPAEVLANLFSPVRSYKNGENRGLGLSIVQGLIKQLNGFISCRSGEWGTAFDILLPTPENTRATEIRPLRVVSTV
jgi:HD-like signal output (HDOD) protein/signal transduction histidine kinase